ncbi:MAG: trypsin-like peptidase domain-containing protein [Burkholderiales bacterium]|nr:S1C family serine protease [Burkholderiales bacterium]MDE1925711.1 trypsin-like peptidase domain-containing protein [Burkholderiales bacterium]MDE2160395.1 trypsin-like peptidase domain-containing protein [Burkholderiales bacterium]MDE2503657.1 trypsin-like peptidase domain-containing protein [Burkholderiales bacterium]
MRVSTPGGWTRRSCIALLALAATGARADLSRLIDGMRPSVLPVGTYDNLASPRFGFRGSGFVVGDGTLLVTNAHVLPEPGTIPLPQLAVLAANAAGTLEPRMASLLSVDRIHDLALLHLEGAPLPALRLAPPGTVHEGMDIALMGFPIGGILGYSLVTHHGIIASITSIALPSLNASLLDARALTRLREGPFPVYQLDATAYPGNSGGPLVDVRSGDVIGIVNMVLVHKTRESALTNPTGITYAIPITFVESLIREH